MKGIVRQYLFATFLWGLMVPVQADTDIEVSGQIRLRQQADKRTFITSATTQHIAELRTRVGLAATVNNNAHAFIQFQDSRVAGAATQFGSPASGDLNDGKNVDIHQAYIQIDNIFGEGWGGKAGRFEFNQGNQRVFGAVGWHNVGRTWDGGMLWYDHPDFKVTSFWLKGLELQDPSYNRDFDIFGLYSNIKAIDQCNLDLFAFYEYDSDTNGYAAGINKLDRINIGAYYRGEYQEFDFEFNGVFQLGTQPSGVPVWSGDTLMDTVKSEVDISAFMLAFEVGYSFEGSANARIAAGIDYASGDDESDASKFKAYNNLYLTGHKFHGYMDYFLASVVEDKTYENAGLMDLMLRGKFNPATGWTIKGDLHYFTTAQDYTTLPSIDMPETITSKDVGIEIDLSVSTTRVAGVNLSGGASVFLPKETFAGMVDPDPGLWGWAMATVNFGK